MDLRVSLVQIDIVWENVSENLSRCAEKLSALAGKTDIAVLPEMFATAFSMKPEMIAQSITDGAVVEWLREQSSNLGIAIVAGVASRSGDVAQFRNESVFCLPSGEIYVYSKRHLFRMAGEHKHFQQGDERLVVEYMGWRIRPFVCYDLRFPVWGRNVVFTDGVPDYSYDCALYIANWPESRRLQWSALLKARAIENQAYVVGVNRVGTDANGYAYAGDSVAFCPKGTELSSIVPYEEVVETVCLDKGALDSYRKRFPFVLDADPFSLR